MSYRNLLKIKVILDSLVEFSVIFSETETALKLEVMDRNQDLVSVSENITETTPQRIKNYFDLEQIWITRMIWLDPRTTLFAVCFL